MNKYTPSLAHLVTLAENRQGLIASLLAIYKQQEDLNDQQVAELLGCDSETLFHLALCERPRSSSHFWNDIEQVANHLHLDPDRLANIIRLAESIEERRTQQRKPFLLAARDYGEIQDVDTTSEDGSNDEY